MWAGARHAWPPEMSHSRRSGWIALLDTVQRAKTSDDPRGVCSDPARAADIFRDYQPAGDTDIDRRNCGLPLLQQAGARGVLLVGSWQTQRRAPFLRCSLLAQLQRDSRVGSPILLTSSFLLCLSPPAVQCSETRCGSCWCRPSAADGPPDDNASNSWAHTSASRL